MTGAASSLLLSFLIGFAPLSQTVSFGYDSFYKNIETYNEHSFFSKYEYESNSLKADAGFRVKDNSFEVTSGFAIYPWQFKKIKYGFTGLYHFRSEKDVYNQQDFYIGGELVYTPVKWFELRPRIAYYGCFSEIIPLKAYGYSGLYNNSTFLSVLIAFKPVKDLNIHLEAGNLEYFKYAFLSSASFTIGADYRFPFGLFLGFDVVSRWTDIVTLSARYEGTDFRFITGYRW